VIYLLTFALAIPSGVIWLFNAEAMVVLQVGRDPQAVPWLIALATTLGQFIGYTALYLFAEHVIARFAFVRRAVAKVRIEQAGTGSAAVFGSGGLVGVPPLLALFTLYGSKRVGPLGLLLATSVPARFCWYCGWAYSADFMRENLSWFA
jgi:hypothetical protein